MRKLAAAIWGLGLIAVALQAAALATDYFQPWLDADYLYPQRFAANVLEGGYPLSGWTLGSAPYLFPDFAGSVLVLAFINGGPVLPYYTVAAYVLLAVLAGWSLRQAGWPGWGGWLAGVALVNGLLALRGMGDHARYLWWLGIPGFHGGAVLAGLAQFAFWAGPVNAAPSRGRFWAATVGLFLGMFSDTLLLTQFVAPLALALAITAGNGWWQAARVRALLKAVGWAIAGIVLARVLLALAGWWTFSKVVRYAPTPTVVTAAARGVARDVGNVFWPNAPGFMLLILFGAGVAGLLAWRARRAGGVERRQAAWFTTASLLSTLALPVVTAYWKDAQNARYLLPLLVMPTWSALVWLPVMGGRVETWGASVRNGWLIGGLSVGFALAGGMAWRGIRMEAWQWPYPDRVAALDAFLAGEKRTHGLADFWHAHYVTTLSHTGLRLNQLKSDARVQFWNNNAFAHYDLDKNSRNLTSPRYDFIITSGLDEPALQQKFGAPARRVEIGGQTLWLYEPAPAAELTTKVEAEVRAYLQDRPGTERISPSTR